MSVDLTLDSAQALTIVGTPIPRRYSLSLKTGDDNFSFEYTNPGWDATWTFTDGAALVRALKQLRQEQGDRGYLHTCTLDAHAVLASAWQRTGIPQSLQNYLAHTKEERFFNEDGTQRVANSVLEGVLNGIEHGSQFGATGPTTLRMVAGQSSVAFFIDDPSQGYELRQLDISRVLELYAEAGFTYGSAISKFSELAKSTPVSQGKAPTGRNLGVACFSRSTKARVGTEKLESGFRLIVLYGENS